MPVNRRPKARRSERSHSATSAERRLRHSLAAACFAATRQASGRFRWVGIHPTGPAELAATRKPRLLFRFDGSFLLRFALRAFLAVLL
jgi:hypothetical protein